MGISREFRYLIALLACSGAQSVWATDVPSELDYLQEFPVVLSASRLSQPLNEAPNAMTVIDRAMIKASGFRTIPDLFRLVPGMYVSAFTGTSPIVSYHGTTDDSARRMQVQVDGRSVFMPPIGAVAWEDLPLQIDDIERIEVIRGPAAASYGGNSTQGVINIITRDAGAFEGFKASVTRGNGGIADANVSMGKRGANLDYRMSVGYRSDHGYDANQYDINNDSHKTRMFNLRSNYHPNGVDSFDFQLGYTEGPRGDGTNNGSPNTPHDKHNHENFAQLTWLRSLAGGDELKLQYYHIYQDVLNTLEPAVPLSDSYTNTRDDLELQHTIHTSLTNRLVWGASVRRDWTLAPSRFLTEQTVNSATLFAHDEWRMTPKWLLNTGALLENSGLGQTNLSPRVALIYKLTAKQTFRIGISKAYRNPSVYEERANYHFPPPVDYTFYLAQGGLRPERILSREIGYLGEFPKYGTSVDIRVYKDQLRDIIYETDLEPKNFVNLFDAEHHGVEVTTKHQWGDHNLLTFNYTFQLMSSEVKLPYASAYSGTMPKHMISALYSKTFSNDVALSLGYYQQGAMLPIDRGPNDLQAFTRRVDVRVAKQFKLDNAGNRGEVALVVQHLSGTPYTDYVVQNQFNRRVFLTASVQY
ncbi:TonB-dependent receptor plug domain-containing protein [Sulfuriferula thiophila]|uniref:TonB-dependent receptor plug domain-containing protein n=1 Tax=Sulfuriferula thiophila TaxID=1781211 RepID=UPI000F60B0DC|nr:TonB-dependent receptor [Sulfuriferula thiophila]